MQLSMVVTAADRRRRNQELTPNPFYASIRLGYVGDKSGTRSIFYSKLECKSLIFYDIGKYLLSRMFNQSQVHN